MSEETNNIIVEANKPITKNPGRVAWGTKLAKMSKDLKEKFRKLVIQKKINYLKKILKLINQQKTNQIYIILKLWLKLVVY